VREAVRAVLRFTQPARIGSVEIHAVGTESRTARYCGEFDTRKEVNSILRITTADGFEGLSGVDTDYQGTYGEEYLLELQGIAADLLALQSLGGMNPEQFLQSWTEGNINQVLRTLAQQLRQRIQP